MKSITIIFKNIFVKDAPLPLGRWKINNCNTQQLNYKIDMANEDHCGPCGEYAIEKNNKYDINNDKAYYKKYDNDKTYHKKYDNDKAYYKKYDNDKTYHKKYDNDKTYHKKYDKKYYKKYDKTYHKKYDAPNILPLNDMYNSDYTGHL
jgi:hypothetical protein